MTLANNTNTTILYRQCSTAHCCYSQYMFNGHILHA